MEYFSKKFIFKFSNFQIKMDNTELKLTIEKALEEIRPFLNSDGGDITLIGVEDGKHVTVRLEGACNACSINKMTLKAGVETTIKKFAPQIETVTNIA